MQNSKAELYAVLVVRLHLVRSRLFTLAIREHSDNRARRINSHGSHERTVQAPQLAIFPGAEGTHRLHAESESSAATKYPPGKCQNISLQRRMSSQCIVQVIEMTDKLLQRL